MIPNPAVTKCRSIDNARVIPSRWHDLERHHITERKVLIAIGQNPAIHRGSHQRFVNREHDVCRIAQHAVERRGRSHSAQEPEKERMRFAEHHRRDDDAIALPHRRGVGRVRRFVAVLAAHGGRDPARRVQQHRTLHFRLRFTGDVTFLAVGVALHEAISQSAR